MEKAKKARTPLRTTVTKIVNELDDELVKVPLDTDKIQLLEIRLEEHKSKVAASDEKILEFMLDNDASEDEIQAEHDGAEEYQRKAEAALIKVRKVQEPIQHSPSPSVSSVDDSDSKKKNYKLPKIELQKFDGELRNWLEWWAHFKKIDEDEHLHTSDKYHYLVQSMEEGSKAQRVVKAYPKTEENYPKAISALKDRFGKPELLIEMYVRELQKVIMSTAKAKEKPSLSVTFDSLETQLNSLESLGVNPDQMTLFLLPFVESCLPEDTLIAWQRSSNYELDGSKLVPVKSRLDLLMEFLRREVEGEEKRKLARSGFDEIKSERSQNMKRSRAQDSQPTVASLYVGQSAGELSCVFCSKKNHVSSDCFKAKRMTVEEKVKKIKEAHACLNCFKKGHLARQCRATTRCTRCSQKHHVVMCPAINNENSSLNDGMVKLSTAETSTTNTNGSGRVGQVLLKTLRIQVKGVDGKKMKLRLLFDEGSQRSYIKTSVAEKLKCPVIERFKEQNNLFGGYKTGELEKQVFKVTVGAINQNRTRDLKLISEDVICSTCPTVPQGKWIEELKKQKIHLTDIGVGNEEIHILIGSDLRDELMTGRIFKLSCGLFAVEWIFGWTLSGPLPSAVVSNYGALTINMLTCEERSLPKLWNLETIGIKDSAEKLAQEEHEYNVKKKVQESLTRDQSGRYTVRLPFINESVFPPSNKRVAEKRLVSATEKLIKQNEYESYDQVFREWKKEGIIEATTGSVEKELFLPHRPVFKPESKSTPVRPVFDGSCRIGKNPSLNQCLEKGPNMLELIPSILLRFREKKIGVISDIRKAFLMVGVSEEDRDLQKFLWWERRPNNTETLDSIIQYRHCRVIFGLNCSPFLLAAVLEHHLNNVSEKDMKVAALLKKSMYVDNCVVSVDSVEEYAEFKNVATEILALAKMELRDWESTVEESKFEINSSVLGLNWNRKEDTLSVQVPKIQPELIITKRNVLSVAAQVFDPIGFTCPALIQPKMQLQDSWTIKLDWDTEWDSERKLKFKKWYGELNKLSEIKIPRKAFGSEVSQLELHTFCDASKGAYAAVVFARVVISGYVEVQLLSAKSRLAPLDKNKKKSVTINRLELLGCVIGARLTKSVKEALDLTETRTYYWTDSSSALAWIKREEDWGTFVGNRTKEINLLSNRKEWNHVPGHLNPADLPSRGCSPAQLVASKWWEGPAWLKQEESCWPSQDVVVNEDEVGNEKRKSPVAVMLNTDAGELPRFSSYLKNIRVAAYLRRFLINCKLREEMRNKSHLLSAGELEKGENDLLHRIQNRHYSKPPIIKNLDVKLKEDGLYHIKTRLLYLNDDELFREPILLPKDDPLVHQLIQYIHTSNCHAGTQFVLGKLREKYWIQQGRKTVGKIIRKCVICRRYASNSVPCEPAPLPKDRIESQFAFQTTGVDLAGPVILKGGKKAWIVLYTCALYRGVYLDIVDSLSTDEFLDSLEKFTCLIGRPKKIYSDNGTNFVGAHNLMKTLNWKKLEPKLSVKQIVWSFNPPSAPWWGGWWERLVRMVKELLRRMLGMAKLTRKELDLCLASVSCTINNRPLTTLNEDAGDLIPLTPAMFIKDLPVAGLPERESIVGKDLQNGYKKLQDLKKALQERFRKEYLGNLVQMKSDNRVQALEVGDVVLVGADNKKRYQWPLGRIMELIPGTDNKIRVAKIKTSGGIFTRPLQRLYPLEVSNHIVKDLIPLPKEIKTVVPETKTRSGREIKKPSRYGEWNK